MSIGSSISAFTATHGRAIAITGGVAVAASFAEGHASADREPSDLGSAVGIAGMALVGIGAVGLKHSFGAASPAGSIALVAGWAGGAAVGIGAGELVHAAKS